VDKVRSNRYLLICKYIEDDEDAAVIFASWNFTTSQAIIKEWYDKTQIKPFDIDNKIEHETTPYIRPLVLHGFTIAEGEGVGNQYQRSPIVLVHQLEQSWSAFTLPLTCSKAIKKRIEHTANKHNNTARACGRGRGRGRGRRGQRKNKDDHDSSFESSDADDWDKDAGDNETSGNDDNDNNDLTEVDNIFEEGIAFLAEGEEAVAHQEYDPNQSSFTLAAGATSRLLSDDAANQQDVSDEEYLDSSATSGLSTLRLRQQEMETNSVESKRMKSAIKEKTLNITNSFSEN